EGGCMPMSTRERSTVRAGSRRRSVVRRTVLIVLAAGVCGAGASIASATEPKFGDRPNPGNPGALVEYSIKSDGTDRTQISDFGPLVDPRVSGSHDFFTLSRSRDGTAFSIGDLYLGHLGSGYPSRTMGLKQLVPNQHTTPPYFGVGNPDFD